MQRHLREPDAHLPQTGQHGLVEVKARRRGSDGSAVARVNRLIPRLIGDIVRTLDIGRQGDMTLLRHEIGEVALDQTEPIEIIFALTHDEPRPTVEIDRAPGLGRLACADLGQCRARIQEALDEDLHPTAGVLAPEQPGTHHPRVVEYQEIARPEQSRQIGKEKVTTALTRRVERKQARRAAIGQRALGDQVGRQVIVKIAKEHGADNKKQDSNSLRHRSRSRRSASAARIIASEARSSSVILHGWISQ